MEHGREQRDHHGGVGLRGVGESGDTTGERHRGVEELRTLDGAVLRSSEARRLSQVAGQYRDVYRDPARLNAAF